MFAQCGTRRLPDGKYEVTLNDLMEVGVFTAGNDAPIYLAKHRVRTGNQVLKIVVPQQPARAGLDPSGKLIEREREDNVVNVEVED